MVKHSVDILAYIYIYIVRVENLELLKTYVVVFFLYCNLFTYLSTYLFDIFLFFFFLFFFFFGSRLPQTCLALEFRDHIVCRW